MTIVGATKNSVGKYLGPSIEVGIDMKLSKLDSAIAGLSKSLRE